MRGSAFFEDVAQLDFAEDHSGGPGKLPVFYYDTSMMLALFPARLRELRKLLPDPRFVPALLAPGIGVVAVACLEHRDTDIGAYGEVGIVVPLCYPSFLLNLPGRALLMGDRRGQIDSYVLHLPVTTEIARKGGVELYNFPKFIGAIEFEDAGGRRDCRLSEDGESILRLSGERLPADNHAEVQYFFHLWMDRQPQRTEFKTNQSETGRSLRPGAATLELGEAHPIARELDALLLSRRSLQYDYIPRLEAILYGPERLSVPLMRRLLDATVAPEERRIRAAS